MMIRGDSLWDSDPEYMLKFYKFRHGEKRAIFRTRTSKNLRLKESSFPTIDEFEDFFFESNQHCIRSVMQSSYYAPRYTAPLSLYYEPFINPEVRRKIKTPKLIVRKPKLKIKTRSES